MQKQVAAFQHDNARRKNIPTAEYQSVLEKEKLAPVRGAAPNLIGRAAAHAAAVDAASQRTDVDGNAEDRKGTVSVFNGPAPTVQSNASVNAEVDSVAAWLTDCVNRGTRPGEIGVFVRSNAELGRALRAVSGAGFPHHTLDEQVDTDSDEVSIGTMHLAKGLEFVASP